MPGHKNIGGNEQAHQAAKTCLGQACGTSAAEDSPEARLFSEPRATAALLQFVGGADLFRYKEHAVKEEELADR